MRNVIDTEHISIRETSPRKRVIRTHVGTYYLDFPYIQYYRYNHYNELYVSASKEAFSLKKKNVFYSVATFNIHYNGQVCQPLKSDLDHSIETFWETSFGYDLPPLQYVAFRKSERHVHAEYYEDWQKRGFPYKNFRLLTFVEDPEYFESPKDYFAVGNFARIGNYSFKIEKNYYNKQFRLNGVKTQRFEAGNDVLVYPFNIANTALSLERFLEKP